MADFLRQIGNSCLATTFARAAELNNDEHQELFNALPELAKGGMTIESSMPLAMSLGVYPNVVVDNVISIEYESNDTDDNRAVFIKRSLLGNIAILSQRSDMSVEEYLEKIIIDHCESLGFLSEKKEFRNENGLDGSEIKPTEIKGFNLFVPIDRPAIVAVNTDGSSVGHAVYWDGSQLYDPNKDAPQTGLDGYSIRQWIPVIKISDPIPKLDDLITRRRKIDELRKLTEEYNKHFEGDEMKKPKKDMKIELVADRFIVRDVKGVVHNAVIGDMHIVSGRDGFALIEAEKAKMIETYEGGYED